MPAKTKEHKIRNDSENQFQEFINSLEWEADPPTHDYGLDYWVEVFINGNPIGDAFRVQLKGTDNLQIYFSNAKSLYSYDIPIERLRDWYSNVLPVYFVLWDTANRRGYWIHIQDAINVNLATDSEWLKQEKKTQKRRIHIPSNNVIEVGNSSNFEAHLSGKCNELRDGQQAIQWIERIRRVQWVDIKNQFKHFESTGQVEDLLHAERLVAIEALLKIHPNDADLWLEKATLHYEQHQFEDGLYAINKANALKPSSTDILWVRGCILCEYANASDSQPRRLYLEAIDNFEQCTPIAQLGVLHYNLGNCYSGLDDHPKAIEHFDRALTDKLPNELVAQIWKNRGTCFFHLGNYVEERRCYAIAIETFPPLWEAYFSWATTSIHLNEFNEAERLIGLGMPYVPETKWQQAKANYLLAYTKWKLSKDEEALSIVDQILELHTAHNNAYLLKAHLLMSLWRQNDKYIEAATRFFGIWTLEDPNNVLAKGELHLIWKAQGELEKARKILSEAILQFDDLPAMMYYDYAILLKDEGKIDEAIKYLHIAADKDVNHAIEHELGHLYLKKLDYKFALHWYKAALASSGNPKHVLRDLADCLHFLQEYRESAIMMMEYLLFDPFTVDCWRNLAIALNFVGLGNLYEAIGPGVDKAKNPQELAIVFDELVIRMFPSRKQDWLIFQNISSHNDDSHH
jgi:tetratricopeptide (TPR) repeat protein